MIQKLVRDPAHVQNDEFAHLLTYQKNIRDLGPAEHETMTYRMRVLDRMSELGLSVESYSELLRHDAQEREYAGGPISSGSIPSAACIYRWWKNREDLVKLARNRGGVGAATKIVNWQAAMILEKLFYSPNARASDVHRTLNHFAARNALTSLSYSTVRRFMVSVTARGGLADIISQFRRGRYYEKYRLAIRHAYGFSNEIWETDGTRMRLKVWDENSGTLIEPHLLLTVDCFSGLPMGWSVISADPTSDDNIRHLRFCLLPKSNVGFWGGMPVTLQSDNAKIYESGDYLAATHELGIKLRKTPPHCPSANGVIERFNSTLKSQFRDGFVECLKTRRKLREKDLQFVGSLESLREHLDAWMINFARTHKRRGESETLLERWQSGLPSPEAAIVDTNLVDSSCLITRECSVTKEGICVRGQMFTAPQLEAMVGGKEKLRVRMNADGDPKVVIARIGGNDVRLTRNIDADGTLAIFCKNPRAFSSRDAKAMAKVLRHTGKKHMADHTPHTAKDLKVRMPRQVPKKAETGQAVVSLPVLKKSTITTLH